MPEWFWTVILPLGQLLVGGLMLWKGGDLLVDRSAHLARSFRVPKHIVGAVILGFGTSLPELLVCLAAISEGDPGIAAGNVVGSNIANVGLILGVAAVISTVRVDPKLLRFDLPVGALVLGVMAWWAFPTGNVLGRSEALILLGAFVAYLLISTMSARKHRKATRGEAVPERHMGSDLTWSIVGLVIVAIGAKAFVLGARGLAEVIGVPSEIIGLSVVALGTSLPELVTTVAAARQGHTELAVGNIAGSNLFNILFVLGGTAAIAPVPLSPLMAEDILIATVFAMAALPFFGRDTRIPRAHGVLLLAAYAGYMGYLFFAGRT